MSSSLSRVSRMGVVVLPALLLVATALPPPIGAQQEGGARIEGVVVDDRTGSPLARARLAILVDGVLVDTGAEIVADERGRFALPRVEAHSLETGSVSSLPFTVLVSKAGFAPARIAVPAASDEQLQVRLRPGAVMTGRVVDESGEPVAGLLVRGIRVPGPGDSHDASQYVDESDDLR